MSKPEIKASWWKKNQPAGFEKNGFDKAFAAAEKALAQARKSESGEDADAAVAALGELLKLADQAESTAKKAKNKEAAGCFADLSDALDRETDAMAALLDKADAAAGAAEKAEAEEGADEEESGEDEEEDSGADAKEFAEIKGLLAKAKKMTLSCAIGLSDGEPLLKLHRVKKPAALATALKKSAKNAGGRLDGVAFGMADLDGGVLTLRAEAVKKFTGAACKKVVRFCKEQKLPVRKVVLVSGNETISGGDDEDGAAPAGNENPATAGTGAAAAQAQASEAQAAGGAEPAVNENAGSETPETEAEDTPAESGAPMDMRPRFKQASAVWIATSRKADADIERIKSALQKTYLNDPSQLPKAMQAATQLDNVFDRYAAQLGKQLAAAAGMRRASAQEWQRIRRESGKVIDDFIGHINSDKLLAAIDADNDLIPGIEIKGPVLRALRALKAALG